MRAPPEAESRALACLGRLGQRTEKFGRQRQRFLGTVADAGVLFVVEGARLAEVLGVAEGPRPALVVPGIGRLPSEHVVAQFALEDHADVAGESGGDDLCRYLG